MDRVTYWTVVAFGATEMESGRESERAGQVVI